MRSLAAELGIVHSKWLYTRRINFALHNHNVEETAQFIRSSENIERFLLNSPPSNEELGRHISDAIVQNSHISKLHFFNESFAIRDMVAWIRSRNTLVNMTSLEAVEVNADVSVDAFQDMSVLDCSALFPLLLTSPSLQSFCFVCRGVCSDDVMTALSSYLSAASLIRFEIRTYRLSEAAFTALCNGVALSTVRQFTLYKQVLQNFDLETAAESLARMIAESSLEEVTTVGGYFEGGASTWSESLISALKLTAPVQNMDLTFTHAVDLLGLGNLKTRLRIRINRKWKPLVIGANTPLALWPHILEKSHSSPETSHGSADIVFYVLTQKPDLVPAP